MTCGSTGYCVFNCEADTYKCPTGYACIDGFVCMIAPDANNMCPEGLIRGHATLNPTEPIICGRPDVVLPLASF